MQDVFKNLKSGKQTDVIIMDFSKAFDKVSHWRLILKLRSYSVTGTVNRWIENFLSEQTQSVVCSREHSDWIPVKSGVPQGSVIGPILFLIYINDLPEEVKAKVNSEDDAASLQHDLDHLASWEKKWQMQFHPQKCSVLCISRSKSPKIFRYHLHGHILQSETNSKYLGITINNKLSWNNHIDNMCKKANNSLAFLQRNLQISQKHIKAQTYTTLIQPQLEYAAAVWDPWTGTKINAIEKVQRRAARYVYRDYDCYSSPTTMMQQLGWRSLEQRRVDIRLAFLYKCVHGLVAIDLSSGLVPQKRDLRHGHSMSYIPIIDTRNYINNSFLPRTIDQWNCLPEHIATSTSLDAFKEGVCGLVHA